MTQDLDLLKTIFWKVSDFTATWGRLVGRHSVVKQRGREVRFVHQGHYRFGRSLPQWSDRTIVGCYEGSLTSSIGITGRRARCQITTPAVCDSAERMAQATPIQAILVYFQGRGLANLACAPTGIHKLDCRERTVVVVPGGGTLRGQRRPYDWIDPSRISCNAETALLGLYALKRAFRPTVRMVRARERGHDGLRGTGRRQQQRESIMDWRVRWVNCDPAEREAVSARLGPTRRPGRSGPGGG